MTSRGTPPSLRERHLRQTRDAILAAFVSCLEVEHESSVSVAAVAHRAGVSVRTVYRHFPSQVDLTAAASVWINENVFSYVSLEHLRDLPSVFRGAVDQFERRPNLAYALARTQIGRGMRSAFRARMHDRCRERMDAEYPAAPSRERARALAAIAVLDNSSAWATLRDELGLSGDEIADSIGWALELVIREIEAAEHAPNESHEGGTGLASRLPREEL